MAISAAVIAAILSILASVGLSYGIDAGANAFDRYKTRTDKVTPSDILKAVDSALKNIKSKSLKAYNEALDKLNSNPTVQSVGNLADYIAKASAKKQQAVTRARDIATEIETAASDIQNRSQMLASQSDSYRRSKTGKYELDQIKGDANELINKYKGDLSNAEKTI